MSKDDVTDPELIELLEQVFQHITALSGHISNVQIGMWILTTCQRDRGPLTEYVRRTTHPNLYILDRTPIESPWIEAYL